MSHYWKKCPYCGRTTEEGYGIPSKRLGDPRRHCRFCSRTYKDSSVIEWETASIFKKAMFYLGNCRLLLTIFVTVIIYAFLRNWTDLKSWAITAITVATFIGILSLCFLYVRHQVKVYQSVYGCEELDTKYKLKESSLQDRYKKYKDDPFGINQSNKSK